MITTFFWIFFLLTLVALVGALYSGWSGQRRWHLVLGPLTLGLLVLAIVFAVLMGQVREFPRDIMRIHRPIALSAGLCGVMVAVTGCMLWRTGRARRAHFVLVLLFSVAAVVASTTGIWAFTQSSPR